ncbi:uncharacterized protein LOC142553385 [Primulina tabacum]|uniref:uncharacterized protein LOC142553385 n=1 Tax=Primulina tabacum TaxID=48773 RepID=UPI003F59E57A
MFLMSTCTRNRINLVVKEKKDDKLKSRTRNEWLEVVVDRNSGRKRKRIDADTGKSVDRTHEGNLKKYKARPVFKDEKRVIRSNFDKESCLKKVDSEQKKQQAANIDVEMSNIAMFRAVCPSSSILSFVEDNLLGHRREIEFRRAEYNTKLSAPLDNIPFSTSSERERIEVPVFRKKLEFFAAAKISSSFPSPDLSEIAFAGRSNMGKSSLFNALTRQWGVVRTSDKPGLTQTINFFKLGPKLSLVDLPGYGFAYAKDEVKESWEELVSLKLRVKSDRVSLKRVCLLVDTKWGMKPRDHELIHLMERYQIVLTKTDLVFPATVARRAMQIEESLKASKSVIQPLL